MGGKEEMDTGSVKKTMGDLVMKHRGQRICVMGGGPSLAADLERVKADVWISVNEHGAKLRPADYVVAMDTTHTELKTDMRKHIRAHTDAPIIGPWGWNDYQILKWPLQPRFMLSGVVATWVASLMGAHPVILAGFDCYGGDPKIVGQHKDYRPHVFADVRVCSGPLVEVFQPYSTKGRMKAYTPPEALDIEKLCGSEVVVKAIKPFHFRGVDWPAGTLLKVPPHEVRMQIKHKSLEIV